MELNKTMLALGGSLAMGLASSAQAGTELDALKTRIAQLEAKQAAQATDVARAAAFSALVDDVLADVDARSSAMAAGTAGHDGKFFLASEDGSSKLNISGQVQARYIWNSRDNSAAGAENDEAGFQMRRTKLKFTGNTNGVGYKAVLSANRDTSNVYLSDVALMLKVSDNLKVKIGRDKLPFNLEELTSSTKQVAVDRTLVNEVFGVGRGEGITLMYSKDQLKTAVAFSDGARSGEVAPAGSAKDFDDNTSNFAVTARVEYLVSGTWDQGKDQSAWSGEGQNLIVGAGVHYQDSKANAAGAPLSNGNSFSYTVDASFENNGLSLTGAFFGQIISDQTPGTADLNHYGATAQAAYFIEADTKQVFARVESIDIETAGNNVIWTAGINCYTKGHAAKFTADVVFATQPVTAYGANIVGTSSGTGLGLLADTGTNDAQTAVRLQYQLLF